MYRATQGSAYYIQYLIGTAILRKLVQWACSTWLVESLPIPMVRTQKTWDGREELACQTSSGFLSLICYSGTVCIQYSSACSVHWIPPSKPGNYALCMWWIPSCGWLVPGLVLLLNICFEKLETREWSPGCSSSEDTLLSAVSHLSVGVCHLTGEGKPIKLWGLYRPGT